MKRLKETLEGLHKNYIYPFFWMHGEDEGTIREEISRIDDCGIKGICVEARPHKDFVGPGWWHDLDIILEECKNRDMKIWILDDSHFPTGYCNGEVKNHPEVQKRYLSCKTYDFSGPIKNASAVISHCRKEKQDQTISVVLGKKRGYEKLEVSGLTELSGTIREVPDEGNPEMPYMTVDFDLPVGEWSLCVLTESFQGGERQTQYHLDPINPKGAGLLLETVYEPHYAHYGAEFGKTLLGFFSDEPRFGNFHGENASIGRNPEMVLPWNDKIPAILAEKSGLPKQEIRKRLPLLFIDDSPEAHVMRYYYMDTISELYAENFDGVIAAWCKEHGCEHIGHTIEDNNSASRLGYGAGHIYRAMGSQDRAGIDVVMHQLMPGMDKGYHKTRHLEGWDGEFFTYLLPKLGSGIAHSVPKMKGRALCELFGAYGWAEGNRLCKWMTDVLLVRGINEFVPHAFDPAPYPDPDCPPHFFAHGNNPQYPEFRVVMDYMNRMSHLLSDGIHRAPAAILYHAEAEWGGDYMSAQKPAAKLTRGMVDFDVLSVAALQEAKIQTGRFRVHQEEYQILVVPYAEALPEKLLQKIEDFIEGQIPVVFINQPPKRSSEGRGLEKWNEMQGENAFLSCVSLEKLVRHIKKYGIGEIETTESQKWLRYYHYEQGDGHIYMFFNEGPSEAIRTRVEINRAGIPVVYDALDNKICDTDKPFDLNLAAGESIMLIYPDVLWEWDECQVKYQVTGRKLEERKLDKCFLEVKPFDRQEFETYGKLNRVTYLQNIPGKEHFCGRIRYTFKEDLPLPFTYILELQGVREGASVSVNDTYCGTRICAPYHFQLEGVRPGENSIVVELNTTLARKNMDAISQYVPLEPTGMDGALLKIFE